MAGTASRTWPKNSRQTVRGMRRHLVQHPARRDDDAVGAFLLHARHAAEELVGHVLAQADLAAGGARHARGPLP